MAKKGGVWDGDGKRSGGKQRSWELVKEFKGPSHKRGGIDIEVGDGYVKTLSGKNIQTEDVAKNGRIWRDVGATAYGIGEGLLDTITMGATDPLTDAGYNALQRVGGSTEDEKREQNSLRGYGTTAGAIGGAVLTGGATTGSAVQQSAKGIGAGVSAGSPDSKVAQQVGQWLPLAGNIAGMAMGNTGFGNSTGTAASIGKFSTQAQKYSGALPLAAQGFNMLGSGNPAEAAQQLSIPTAANSALQTMQIINSMRRNNQQAPSEQAPTKQKSTESHVEGATTSIQPNQVMQINTASSVVKPQSKYRFLNDLKSYGINA